MLLSAEILFDRLPAELNASMAGPHDVTLALGRPVLAEGNEEAFRSGRVYLLHGDRLPARTHAEKGALIACIGDSPHLARYQQRCCVLKMPRDTDFFHAFNALQAIYDEFDAWEADLRETIDQDGDISRMLARSEEVFGEPLYAIGEDFRILGASPLAREMNEESAFESEDGSSLRLSSFDQFLELHDLSMDEREPMLITLLDQTTLNYNLFEGDAYQGCLTLHYRNRAYRASDKSLIAFLGEAVLLAIKRLSRSSASSHRSLRQAAQGLIEGIPLDIVSRQLLEGASDGREFACMRLKMSSKLEQLPLGYVRNMLESAFPRSIAFEHHRNSVVCIIDIAAMEQSEPIEAIRSAIEPFTGSMGMKAGLSNRFGDLISAHLMFLQANMALDDGILFDPGKSLYLFRDYALREMVMSATSQMPLELLFPPGLHRLLDHDRDSETSYVDTLRTYLDNNMAMARTAGELYVHRSTLIERLGRIRRELDLDLDDAEVQLQLRILLKAIELRDALASAEERD